MNQERWDLNAAAVVQWARAHGKHISVFIARHVTEDGRQLSADELSRVLLYGDDSKIQTPGLFWYAQGMPVVVTKNEHVGLKLVNGGPFSAVEVFPDPHTGAVALTGDVTLHLGPPAAVLVQSDEIAGISIPGLPPGTLLLKSKPVPVPATLRGTGARAPKPGFRWVTYRIGPWCTPAFAMTDQKSQGKQFKNVLLNLKSVFSAVGSGSAAAPSFMTLYVQLSRSETWEGIQLSQRPARTDFIEPKNVMRADMVAGVRELEQRGEETLRELVEKQGGNDWFEQWKRTVDEI
ncbi:hypothetical protein BX600DRAFT_485118 [Xylariales sp. PMI_506]|nr:hypothetical protein BX600DRAFT_485118 [Xylariales sp. PMI_506]